jgi:hypothetical protein
MNVESDFQSAFVRNKVHPNDIIIEEEEEKDYSPVP